MVEHGDISSGNEHETIAFRNEHFESNLEKTSFTQLLSGGRMRTTFVYH
jgi:hypothetical protein